MNRVFAWVLVLLAISSVPVSAQEQTDVIVVESDRDKVPSTTQIVRALSKEVDGSIPRFQKPVCPGVAGLRLPLATAIVARMRENIGEAGQALAAEGCTPNLTLIFTDDGQQLIQELISKSPRIFGLLTAHEIGKLKSAPGPSWAWHATVAKRADGGPVADPTGIPPGPKPKGSYSVPNASLSRLSSPVRRDIEAAFVVITVDAISGLTVRQLADYATLRGLSVSPNLIAREILDDSILSLFDDRTNDRDPVDQLTSFDRAYLSGVYSGSAGLTYRQKTKLIAQAIERSERD